VRRRMGNFVTHAGNTSICGNGINIRDYAAAGAARRDWRRQTAV